MSLDGLSIALTGLSAAQQQLDVISSNIANASTPGYTRKILPQSSTVVANQPAGVQTGPILRDVDMNLSQEFWTQSSAVSGTATTSSFLQQIQQYHGDPTAETNVSAALSNLQDAFSSLSDSPSDASLQSAVVNQAQVVAQKVQGFGQLVTQMRNDTQTQMQSSVQSVNTLLTQIAQYNTQIAQNQYVGTSTANLADQRDQAIATLSQQMQVTTFQRSDGVLVVQTAQGQLLADNTAQQLYFDPKALSASSGTGAGIYIGDPTKNANAVNITQSEAGGTLGALIDLRDTTLPGQQAEMDELAEQTAQRFSSQGLNLFTDQSGSIPSDATPAAGQPVAYVGFSSDFQVNPAVTANNSLVQTGTAPTDAPVQAGSNEVISRITNFAFGDTNYQTAAGTTSLLASASGGTTLQNWLGIHSSNQINGSTALSNYSDISSLETAGATPFTNGTSDSFTLTFADSRVSAGPVTATVSLTQAATDFPISATITNAGQQIAAEINKQIGSAIAALPVAQSAAATALNAKASVNAYGQLVLTSTGNITVDASAAGQMGTDGLQLLGLTAGTQATTDPSFTVQVGTGNPQTITIGPADTETDLLAKLQYNSSTGTGIPGLDASIDPATGALTLRPGGDTADGGPRFGGALSVTGSSFTADGTGTSGKDPSGTSLMSALFGSNSPVTNVAYSTTDPFRSTGLGLSGTVTTDVSDSSNIIDYSQNMIDAQTAQATDATTASTDATTYQQMVQQQLTSQSGVNIDQELSQMIVVQTAYAAAAKVMTTINQSFQELLSAYNPS